MLDHGGGLRYNVFTQARDGGLLEEVQRSEEAEGRHLDHNACVKELLK